jgi:hypothetical protein
MIKNQNQRLKKNQNQVIKFHNYFFYILYPIPQSLPINEYIYIYIYIYIYTIIKNNFIDYLLEKDDDSKS